MNRFPNGFREKRLNVRDSVLRVSGDGDVSFDGFAVRVFGFDGGHHFGFVKSEIRRQVDGDLEFRQNVFGNLEMFGETLTRHDGRDVPVTQNGLIRQLQL